MTRQFRLLTTGGAVSVTLAVALAVSSGVSRAQARQPAAAASSSLRFDVSFVPQIHDQPITGRAFVMVTRSVDKQPEPRLQIGRTGVPFFGRDVEQLQPEKIVSIDGGDLGTPLESINDIPAGDYYVQAVVVVYSEFRRADGHVLWMHDDQWEGQHWNRAPGTLYSAVEKVHIDPKAGGVISWSRPGASRRSMSRPTPDTSSGSSSRARC